MRPLSDLETQARDFAVAYHGNQKYDGRPYVEHLEEVRNILVEHSVLDEDMLIAAWLHDVIEDEPFNKIGVFSQVMFHFGLAVADLVWAVTGMGTNRKKRNHNIYEKLKCQPKACLLKLADRLANVRNSSASRARPGYLEMYRQEHTQFSEAIKAPVVDEAVYIRKLEMLDEISAILFPTTKGDSNE